MAASRCVHGAVEDFSSPAEQGLQLQAGEITRLQSCMLLQTSAASAAFVANWIESFLY